MGGVLIAIYSLNINIKSRGKGQSAIAAAAYIAGERFKNEYDGLFHDRTDRNDVVHREIVLPENAPLAFLDRATLWNAVEQSERAKNAQLCREVRLALPKDFTLEQNINLVLQYVNENFVSRGMVADIAIHDKKDDNVHAHVLLTMRPLEKNGTFGAKSRMEYILDDNGEKMKLPSGRYKTRKITTTDWDNRDNAELWRKNWADTLNKYLEYHEHETRVDHRSYERQGLEILPAIHLGAVAHALEQKGIQTERGNTNRRIKAANARLKNIDAQIYEILNPPKPKFLIDIENSIKAQESPGYEHWARIFNIQQMAKTLIYIQENGYTDWQSLNSAYLNSAKEYNAMSDHLPVIKQKMKALKTLKKHVETYRRTAETYKKYTAPHQLAYFKNQFYDKHKTDIEAHKGARAYIYDELKLTKFPNLKKLNEEINQLAEEEKKLREAMPIEKEKFNSLKIARHNASMLLGYKNLEQRSINPIADIQRHGHEQGYADIPILKKTYIQSAKSGEAAQYFQNKYINRECAEAIEKAVDVHMKLGSEIDIATRFIETYGIERVKWVIATVIANDTSGKLDSYKDWAEKMELPNEPIDKSVFEIGDTKRMVYPYFIRAVQIKDAVIRQGRGEKLSHEDNMAVAKLKADEHNNRNTQPVVHTPVVHRPSPPVTQTQQYSTPTMTPPQKPTPAVEVPPPKPKKKNRGVDR